MSDLTHMDSSGHARMVDVGDKQVTERTAIAEGRVRINAELAAAISHAKVAKGNLLDVARLAGILAAKRTDELIPMCHTLPLDSVQVEAALGEKNEQGRTQHFVFLRATCRVSAKTGIEMEALTAVSVAALTVIDMGKAIDKGMMIEQVRLVEKRGGRHGVVTPHPSEFPRKA